ncbi:MAG: hypothetical protein V4439_00800 [Patescibacteria group bacterium]
MYNKDMNFKLKNFIGMFTVGIFAFFILVLPVVSLANTDNTAPATVQVVNPISVNDLNGFLKVILEGVVKIGMPIIALAIIYCGFLFVSAQGNTAELETAKKSLMYTLIGAALLLGAWAIAQLITETITSL